MSFGVKHVEYHFVQKTSIERNNEMHLSRHTATFLEILILPYKR